MFKTEKNTAKEQSKIFQVSGTNHHDASYPTLMNGFKQSQTTMNLHPSPAQQIQMQPASSGEESTQPDVVPLMSRPDLLYEPGSSETNDTLIKEISDMGIQAALDKNPAPGANAAFDVMNNLIWLPEKVFNNKKNEPSVKRDIVHELQHALQNKEVIMNNDTPESRQLAIDKEIVAMTEEAFVVQYVNMELEAERVSWQSDTEVVNTHEKQKGGKGFPKELLENIVQQRMNDFENQTKEDYENKARTRYQLALKNVKSTK